MPVGVQVPPPALALRSSSTRPSRPVTALGRGAGGAPSSSTPVTSRGPGTREVGGRVHRHDALGAQRGDARSANASASSAERARRSRTASRPRRRGVRLPQLVPGRGARTLARHARARRRRRRSRSSPAPSGPRRTAGRATRSRARAGARAPGDGAADGLDARAAPARAAARLAPERRPPRRAARGRPAPRRASSGRARARAGGSGSVRRDRDDVVVGDGADLADRLGDDQVGRELRQALARRARRAAGRPRPSRARCGRSRRRTGPAGSPCGSGGDRRRPPAANRTRA